jgi:hypothetical protein
MTLGRTDNKIKIKTDGSLRAVECACCAPPPDWTFRIGFIKVEASFERTRCATWDGLSESLGFFPLECGGGDNCIGDYDPTPLGCVLDEMWSELNTCGSSPAINKWTKELTISEASTTMNWCGIPSDIEECSDSPGITGYGGGLDSCPWTDPQSATYGIDYEKTWTESGYTTTHSEDGANNSSHAQSICEIVAVGGGETALNKTGSLYAFHCSFSPCGKTNGEFSISENSFTIPATYYKDGICHDAQDADSWYEACNALPNKTTQPATVTYAFDEEASSAFISSAMGALPSFPSYSTARICEVGLSESAESSFYVEAIMSPSSVTEECPATNLVSKVSGKKTKFKIIHNVSPTSYLKVWVKRGKIDINTGDFSSASVEIYEIDEGDFEGNPQSAIDPGCTAFYSNEYTLDLQIGDYESADDWINNGGIGRADEYAYILKYSFVEGYEPPTTGTGINERCAAPCNGYPPPPPTP